MEIKEFRSKGLLQEVNRLFFHPMGLALSVNLNKDGSESLADIIDYREDPEGMYFADGCLDAKQANFVYELKKVKEDYRKENLGYIIQPVKGITYE